MDEAEATQGEDAPENTAPAPQPEASPPVIDWSHLRGFQTVLEPGVETPERSETYAGELAKELATRAARFVQSVDDSIVLASDGVLRWLGDPIARVVGGEDLLRPRVVLLADDALSTEDRMAVDTRLSLWIAAHVRKVLGPLEALQEASELSESAREIARAIVQALGVLERERVRGQVKTLDQTARAGLRKLGVRFGSLYLYVPNLLKPAARSLCSQLWALRRGPEAGADLLLAYASAGRTSFANEGTLSPDTYRVAGFRLCGERVVRVDIIERLSDLIRAAIPDHMRAGSRAPSDAYGFLITPQMTSLTGCAGEAFASILRSLGFESHKVKRSDFETANRKAPTAPIQAPAPALIPDAAPPADETSADPVAAQEDSSRPEAIDEGPSDTVSLESDPESPPETMAELAPAAEPEITHDHEVAAAPSEPEAVEAGADEGPAEPVEAEAAPEIPDGLVGSPAEGPESLAPEASESEASAEPDVVETAEAVPAAEEEEVEIWRPAPRRPRPAPRPPRAPGEAREPGRFQGRRGEPRRHGRDAEPAPAPLAASGEAGPTAEAVSETAAEPRRHEGRGDRPDRQRHDQPRHDQQRHDQPRHDQQRHGDRPPRSGQPPRRDEGRPQEPKRGGKDAPPRREPRPVTVDPDSPFAKLLALKPLLERRDKRP